METASSLSFLTSDNPVVNLPGPDNPKNKKWGYAKGNILLPLSPKRALLFAVRYSGFKDIQIWNRIVEVQRKRMPELQFYTITQCRSVVYSHVSSKEVQRVLDSGKAQTATVSGA